MNVHEIFQQRETHMVPVAVGFFALLIGEICSALNFGGVGLCLKAILVLAFSPYFGLFAGAAMGFLGFLGSGILIIIPATIACAVVGYFGKKGSWEALPALSVFALPVMVILLLIAGELKIETLSLMFFSILAAICLSWLLRPFIRVIKLIGHYNRL